MFDWAMPDVLWSAGVESIGVAWDVCVVVNFIRYV